MQLWRNFTHLWRNFHEAIRKGEQKGYHIAWSNPCFEYWLFLHFEYSDASLHRKGWSRKLSDMLQDYQLATTYQKNEEHLYELLDSIQGVDRAIRYAKRRMAACLPFEYNPTGTTVYLLVEELKSYIDKGCQ